MTKQVCVLTQPSGGTAVLSWMDVRGTVKEEEERGEAAPAPSS